MKRTLNEQLWYQLHEDIMIGMREWRWQHPQATLREIETALDARLAHARARMLEDRALQSTAAPWQESSVFHAPTCPHCGTPLQERGMPPRMLVTHGGQEIIRERSYGVCATCTSGLCPPRCGSRGTPRSPHASPPRRRGPAQHP